jgi:hypothetical protein
LKLLLLLFPEFYSLIGELAPMRKRAAKVAERHTLDGKRQEAEKVVMEYIASYLTGRYHEMLGRVSESEFSMEFLLTKAD